MNATYKDNSFSIALLGSFVVLALAMTFSFGLVHTAHAQDYGGDYSYTPDYGGGYSGSFDYGYNGGCCDYSGYSYTPDASYSYTPDSSFSYTPDSSFSYTPDAGYSYAVDSGYSYTPDYGYTYTPDTGYAYTSDSYLYGSSYSVGGGYGGYYGGGYSYPSYGGGGYNNVNTNSNYTYTYSNCVGTNNCNTANTIITNPSPTVTYTSPSYSYPSYSYPSYSYPSYSYSQPYTPPVIITSSGVTNPYISLSSIPYTGLELGFWGTLAYWGFLILWCLFAAYLIVVKRVQNKFMAFLFGEKVTEPAKNFEVSHASHMPQQHQAAVRQNRSDDVAQALTYAPASAKVSDAQRGHDAIDSFIMSQIQNRARA
ncbi:phosphatidylethanolamine N-methyltransferase family protein [Patescibacteria group bacterium]|nr:phosphatidylethanolamine N-methyltransferase family protein [Patescibacteria group bacterium]